jgi:hypothetical protein
MKKKPMWIFPIYVKVHLIGKKYLLRFCDLPGVQAKVKKARVKKAKNLVCHPMNKRDKRGRKNWLEYT